MNIYLRTDDGISINRSKEEPPAPRRTSSRLASKISSTAIDSVKSSSSASFINASLNNASMVTDNAFVPLEIPSSSTASVDAQFEVENYDVFFDDNELNRSLLS